MLQNMDTSVDPCEDFYKYACGLFDERTYVDGENVVETTQSLNFNQYLAEIRHLLDTPKLFYEPEAVWKAKDFFFACMNISNDDDSMLLFLEDLGYLPLLQGDMWSGDNFNWIDMSTYLHRLGFSKFGLFEITKLAQTGGDKISILPSYLTLESLFTSLKSSKSEDHKNLTSFIQEFIALLGADSKINRTEEIHKVVDLMSQINHGVNGKSFDMSIGELQRRIPSVKWKTVIQTLFNKKIQNSTIIHVSNFLRLQRTVTWANASDIRTVTNYILLNLLASLYQFNELNFDLQSQIKALVENYNDDHYLPQFPPRIIQCIQQSGEISGAVNYMYFKKYLNYEIQAEVLRLEEAIRSQFRKAFENAEVKHEIWKDVANLLKMNADAEVIGGSAEMFLDEIYLDRLYSELSSHRSDFFANVLAKKKFRQRLRARNYESIREINKNHLLVKGIKNSDVIYEGAIESGLTKTDLPPVLMRGLMFGKERSSSLNFAFLGVKIMEGMIEYLNRFMGQVSSFDKSKYVFTKFEDMKRCMIAQFDSNLTLFPEANYVMKSTTDKSSISTEMTEQLIAVTNAYKAFKNWKRRNERKEFNYLLPGIDADENQLFWLGYVTSKCDAYDEEVLSEMDKVPSYPQRIIMSHVLRNSPEFSRDFNCPLNSYMNPPNKCKLLYD